jgi:hypothetical protein
MFALLILTLATSASAQLTQPGSVPESDAPPANAPRPARTSAQSSGPRSDTAGPRRCRPASPGSRGSPAYSSGRSWSAPGATKSASATAGSAGASWAHRSAGHAAAHDVSPARRRRASDVHRDRAADHARELRFQRRPHASDRRTHAIGRSVSDQLQSRVRLLTGEVAILRRLARSFVSPLGAGADVTLRKVGTYAAEHTADP